MTYRNDVDALAARHAALEVEVADRTRERDQAADLLRDARARARLPVLDNIRVAAPCSADWNQMVGSDRVRHCGDCKKNVFNLSEMTRDEAEAVIIAHEGKLCVRYFQRADGTILTKDCAIGVRRRRRRRIVAAGLAITAASSIFGYEMTKRGTPMDPPVVMMGDIASAPPPVHGEMVTGGMTYEPPAMPMQGKPVTPAPPPTAPTRLERAHKR